MSNTRLKKKVFTSRRFSHQDRWNQGGRVVVGYSHPPIFLMNNKGPFKYYVIKEVGGWGWQMMMFDDEVGGWGWLNDDVSKKYTLSVSKLTLISLINVTSRLPILKNSTLHKKKIPPPHLLIS